MAIVMDMSDYPQEMPLSAIKAETRDAEITREIKRIEGSIDNLGMEIARLQEKLGPVLSPINRLEGEDKPVPPVITPLGQRLSAILDGTEKMIGTVLSIRECVEL